MTCTNGVCVSSTTATIVAMFASEREGVIPDLMILGKGLAAGCLPLALTLIFEKLFSAFDVLMPPLCITIGRLTKAVDALRASITIVWRASNAFARKDAEEVTA